MRFDSLEKWLNWLENCHPRKWDLGLERVSEVARRMQVLQPAPLVFLVAGTNGKGSVIAYIEQFCISAGLRVGSSTSPHLLKFNERIRIAGQPVSDDVLVGCFDRIDKCRADISLTYFEFATLASLGIFLREQVDVAVLEVGLGGRLDAMNIVDPDIAVIATIDLDHQDWLGETREEIGAEKAGIFRPDRVAVVGEPSPPDSIYRCARGVGARLIARGHQFDLNERADCWEFNGIDATGRKVHYPELPLPELPLADAATAIQTVLSAGIELEKKVLRKDLTLVKLPGRFQKIMKHVPVILDVAHNPEAARYLRDKLHLWQGDTHAVVAMYKDKDYSQVLNIMSDVVDHWYMADHPDLERGASGEELMAGLGDIDGPRRGPICSTYAKVSSAYEEALSSAKTRDRVVAFGSFAVVADVLVSEGIQKI